MSNPYYKAGMHAISLRDCVVWCQPHLEQYVYTLHESLELANQKSRGIFGRKLEEIEATPHCIDILISIREYKTIMFR